ncbi:MAG: hypothetical protein GXO84_09490 [Chlorobi bacterium]|nr:hypothetical protein [Chlorobiota bacterium]
MDAPKARATEQGVIRNNMKDIEVIGNNYVQGSYQLLPESADRVRAALHFAELCEKEANKNNEKTSRWYYRASLSEYKSIFDVLKADFKNMGIAPIWKQSEFKETLSNNTLVTVLSKARDLAIHSASLKGNHKKKLWQYLGDSGETPVEQNSIFFDEIKKDMLNDNASYITDKNIAWFNKQSSQWPVFLLVREAIYQSSVPIANFLTVNHKRITMRSSGTREKAS